MSRYKPYLATPEQMIADGYDAEEVAHAVDVRDGRAKMPGPRGMTDALYAVMYQMSREEVALGREIAERNRKLRNAGGKPRPREMSLARIKPKRLSKAEVKSIIRIVADILADPQAMALVGNLDELYKYIGSKPK